MFSPVIFSISIDTFLVDLKKSAVGCTWGGKFAKCFAYADDIVLLAPSMAALRLMLGKCEVFAIC